MKTKRTRIKTVKVASSSDFNIDVLQVKNEGRQYPKLRYMNDPDKLKSFFGKNLRTWIDETNEYKPSWAKVNYNEVKEFFNKRYTELLAKKGLERLFVS